MKITKKVKVAASVSVLFLFVFVTVKVVNNFNLTNNLKVADEVRTEFDFSKTDCDGVDMKGAKGFLTLISRFGGLFTQVNVTINNFSPTGGGLGGECLSDFRELKTNPVTTAEDKPLLKNIAGLDRVVTRMLQSYNSADYSNALESANLGLEMITPVLKPYMSKSFSIEARLAFNASAVYALIAEDAWSKHDYSTALTNVGYAASLAIPESKAELLAMARAIHLDERGSAEDVIPSDVLALLKGASNHNKADTVDFLYRYINALAQSGYILPVLEDENGRSWQFDATGYFGFKERIDFKGVFKVTNMRAKDGTPMRLGKWFTARHAGLGKLDMAMVGEAEGRILESGFDMKKYHWRSTEKVVGKQLSLFPIEFNVRMTKGRAVE